VFLFRAYTRVPLPISYTDKCNFFHPVPFRIARRIVNQALLILYPLGFFSRMHRPCFTRVFRLGDKANVMAEPVLFRQDDFISAPNVLYATLLSEVTWDERIKARKTASLGVPYDYSGMTYETLPLPPLLVPIIDRLEVTLGFRPNNCLLNFYENGDSTMGFHADGTEVLREGTGIAIISLGSERTITFRRTIDRSETYDYSVRSGSLLYMSQEIQKEWQHAIPKQPDTGGRISLTFRQIGDDRARSISRKK
jgi:alkylated DNA repair dioxygenase AlkB